MKKHILVIFMFLVLILFAVSAEINFETFYNNSFKISAYKIGKTAGEDGRPTELIDIRITDPGSNEVQVVSTQTPISETPYLDVPVSARTSYYTAFYWSMYGNYYNSLQLRFIFYPMVLYANNQPDYSNCIPYNIKLVHNTTKIGNTEIDVNRDSTLTTPIKEEYSGLYFYYADSISGDISINNSNVTPKSINSGNTSGVGADVSYNMRPNSRVEEWIETEQNGVTTTQITTITYTDTICNYWSRSGRAEILLEVPSGIEDDRYYAIVRMEIIKE